MSYTVKLAIFPPWKAPVPYETLAGVFATITDAAEAGTKALAPITEQELSDLQPKPLGRGDHGTETAAIVVPEKQLHGWLIYNESGVEIYNWNTLDVALARTAID